MRDGWASARLSEVCLKIQDGAHRSPQKFYAEGGVGRFPYITSKNIRNGYMELDDVPFVDAEFHNSIYPRCNPELGDVLLTKDGANTGNVTINTFGEPFSLLSSVCMIKTDPTKLVPKFLVYYIQSDAGFEQITGNMTGAAIKRIILQTIKSSSIPLPALAEQRRIVAILDEVFAALATASANAEKNVRNARELFESLLSQSYDGFAQECGSRRLADIVTRLTNGYVGPTRNIYLQSGVPYLLARHVRDNRLEFDGKTYVSNEFNEKNKKSKLKAGDVLLVQSGHIGHSAVVGSDHADHNCHAMIVITPMPHELSGEFLSFYFGSNEMKRKFEEIRSGSTVPHLTCGLVRELMIPLPKVEEQRELVAVLRKAEKHAARLSSLASDKVQRLAQLKQSVLRKAFSGELTSLSSEAINEAAE